MFRFLPFLTLALMMIPCGPAAGQTSAPSTERPNVLLILVDDLGWADLGCQGSSYLKTPHLDGLAAQGIRFTQAYAACAVCSPTRAALLTGRYPHRLGVTDWIRSRFQRPAADLPAQTPADYVGDPDRKLLCPPNPFRMELDELTIAEALREAHDYRTGFIGKWHLGDPGWYPEDQGFEVNRGGCDYGQPPSYFDPYNQPNGKHPTLQQGLYQLPGRQEGEYLTVREADEAIGLLRQWQSEPFFLQWAPYAVHTPIQAPKGSELPYLGEGRSTIEAKYAAMVAAVDEEVGRVLGELESLELADRTLVIFTSDNGGLDRQGEPTDNAPLRSGKGYPYEGGIRVPLLMRWPSVIPAGQESAVPVSSIDLFPTIMDATGTPIPGERRVDGLSLWDHVKSVGKKGLQRSTLIWHFPHYRHDPGPYSIIRHDDWKLIHFWEGIQELYDLAADPAEARNLAVEHPHRVRELHALLLRNLQLQEAKIPRANPKYRPE